VHRQKALFYRWGRGGLGSCLPAQGLSCHWKRWGYADAWHRLSWCQSCSGGVITFLQGLQVPVSSRHAIAEFHLNERAVSQPLQHWQMCHHLPITVTKCLRWRTLKEEKLFFTHHFSGFIWWPDDSMAFEYMTMWHIMIRVSGRGNCFLHCSQKPG
jgi:hypothetical protein